MPAAVQSRFQGPKSGDSTTWPRRTLAPAAAKVCAGSFALVGIALVFGLALQYTKIAPSAISLIFLTAVLASSIRYGLWPGLLACLVSILAYNFFFFEPLYTLTIADPRNVIALFVFALVAVVASNLAARVRTQALLAQQRAAVTENLYLFSRKLAEVFTLDDLLWAICFQMAQMLNVRVVLLLPEQNGLAVRGGYPPEDDLPLGDWIAARSAWKDGAPAGRGTSRCADASYLFVALKTGRGSIGVVGLDSERAEPVLAGEREQLFQSLADQASVAIERFNLAQEIERARIASETERLRTALLSSISHDLKTPLASILGSATSLKYRETLDETAQAELVRTIEEEAERLNRFIANLLDMTRLESGNVRPNLDTVDLGDVVGSALRRAGKILERHRVEIGLEHELPLLRLDPVLFEQVIFNLLDNAAKYAPPGSTIAVKISKHGENIRLEIVDEGPGIPPENLERIFDPFYRVQTVDRTRAGTGLGLAICRGFILAMNGSIAASNRQDRQGAIFTITLPVSASRPGSTDR